MNDVEKLKATFAVAERSARDAFVKIWAVLLNKNKIHFRSMLLVNLEYGSTIKLKRKIGKITSTSTPSIVNHTLDRYEFVKYASNYHISETLRNFQRNIKSQGENHFYSSFIHHDTGSHIAR